VFERFTAPACEVVELAQQESDRLGHNYLGPEHVLAGIARHTSARAARMLRDNGVDLETMRAEIDRLVRHGFLPPPWRSDASLLSGLGVDLAGVRRSAEETFGGKAVDEAVRRVSRRSWLRGHRGGWTPLCGKAMMAKRAFYLAGAEATELRRQAVDPEHLLLGVLADAEAPARWTRRTKRMRAYLGFPQQPGPDPVKAVIEACGLTVTALREAILAELRATA
jgi:hypothetical protein